LRDIKKIKVLTPAEEELVIQQIKQGDEKAKDTLICANLRFVITVAKEYQNQGLDLNDLISEGNLGLVKAAVRFDSTIGVRFYSYAVWWVRQSIIQALNDYARTIRLPVNVITTMSKKKKELQDLDYINWCAKQGVLRTYSLNQPVGEDGEEFINTVMGTENDAFKSPNDNGKTLSDALMQVMSLLTERERDIIMQYYGVGGPELTLQQIADDMNLTKERVRQIKNQAIKKLRFNAPLLFKFFHD
jgi:RNA polymerase primary sigma factor